MKSNLLFFIIGFIVAFGIGYFIFNDNTDVAEDATEPSIETEDEVEEEIEQTQEEGGGAVPTEAEPLSRNNCLSCHAVESLGASGGTTGPDLSNAYTDVEGKHGKPLNEYLQDPTSAVMSSVIGGNPLPDEEREAIVEALKIASEK